ncbi:fgfr1 oncogene partner [Nannochloropsis oceanica]
MTSTSPQKWAEEDMPPPQHQQQQQTGAGPDKEMMEVKQLLKQALGGAGILNHARALLVAGVHLVTDRFGDGQRPEASLTHLRLLHPNQRAMAAAETEEGRLALGLVADLLDSLGLRHSLSIFLPEANLDDGTAVGEGQPQQQQQQHPPSHWRSLQQAVVETLELDSDTGSEDPLLLQFMRRQMEKKRLRSESEAKEEGEEGDGKGRKEEGEEEAMLAPGGQEQALAARQQMVEKNGVEEITGAVEEAIAYEEEEEEGRSRNGGQHEQEEGDGSISSAVNKRTGEGSGSSSDDDNDDEVELRLSMDKVAIQAEAETIQEQEEEEDVEDGVRDVALTQVFPSLVQQEDSVADDEEVLKG